ncbi:MAG: ABC transporter ATP-binding protein [Bacteroidetes bacterium]|nr:ABC transporter ATP-binding protein [Bacteroidota bacterium]
MSLVIKAENISKQYRLGAVGMSNLTDDVQRLIARIRGKEDPFLKVGDENSRDKAASAGDSKFVWALRDINFEINQGEVVGIIGKNGAGKSTLLKILSRVTEPSIGRLKYKGRLASLLEVGTGFHPDLSGRDNVFLNGAILGMKKQEIAKKFDEIIEFSGVAKYIDTPVKRYSSGMYVRLAFAVAAHLDPDILVIDEVLAVGDIEFQEKCLGKMKDVAGEGRTVLFVSHNMASIKSLCKRGIVMQKGTVTFDGNISDSISNYLAGLNTGANNGTIETFHRTINTGKVFFKTVEVKNEEFLNGNSIYFNHNLKIACQVEFLTDFENVLFDARIISADGIEVLHTMNIYDGSFVNIQKGMISLNIELENKLQPGKYFVNLGAHLSDGLTLDYLEHILELNILNVGKDNEKGLIYDFKLGYYRPNTTWKITQ